VSKPNISTNLYSNIPRHRHGCFNLLGVISEEVDLSTVTEEFYMKLSKMPIFSLTA
jgi:hypothetical protein